MQSTATRGTSSWYDEPGRVESPAVQAVVVWVLSVVLSSRLIETTLFYEITFYVG